MDWPDHQPFSFSVVLKLQAIDWMESGRDSHGAFLSGGLGPRPHPNIPLIAHREYGFRVGLFRLLDGLASLGIVPTVAMDSLAAERYPRVVEILLEAGAEIVAAGRHGGDLLTSRMTADEEQAAIEDALRRLRVACGRQPRGWFGPEYSESTRTPGLLAAAGIEYVLDWPNDEQPFAMTTETGSLTSLPVTYELDDEVAMWQRGVTTTQYARMIGDAGETLAREGVRTGRTFVLVLSPWLSGQPFRIRKLLPALTQLVSAHQPWIATCGEVVDFYRDTYQR